jgi:hypothetical protein
VREQLLQQLNAVHAGHLQIGQGQVEAAIPGEFQRRFSGRGGRHVIACARQDFLQDVTLRLFVVNYQY